MRALTMALAVGLLLGCATARADTALVSVTPKNLKENRFQLTAKAGPNLTVEFVVRRDITGIEGPGRQGYLSDADSKSLGTPVKLEEEPGKALTFRFSLPEAKVATTKFTLWGQGVGGEGVTFRFRPADFWNPAKLNSGIKTGLGSGMGLSGKRLPPANHNGLRFARTLSRTCATRQ